MVAVTQLFVLCALFSPMSLQNTEDTQSRSMRRRHAKTEFSFPEHSQQSKKLEEKILELFTTGAPGTDVVLFNSTVTVKRGSDGKLNAAFGQNPSISHIEQTGTMVLFNNTVTVKRGSDGKLNAAFGENPSNSHIQPIENREIHDPQVTQRPSPDDDDEDLICANKNGTIERGYCSEVVNYPDTNAYIDFVKREFGAYFSDEKENMPDEFQPRNNEASDEEFLCDSERVLRYPKQGKTAAGKLALIMQNEAQNLTQGIKIEQCLGENANCKMIGGCLPRNREAYCKQVYVFRPFIRLPFDKEDRPQKDDFLMPYACKCALKIIHN